MLPDRQPKMRESLPAPTGLYARARAGTGSVAIRQPGLGDPARPRLRDQRQHRTRRGTRRRSCSISQSAEHALKHHRIRPIPRGIGRFGCTERQASAPRRVSRLVVGLAHSTLTIRALL